MGIVPQESEHIFTNYEKMKFIYPKKDLNKLQKLIRKSVATQTVDFTKVFFFQINFLFKRKSFISFRHQFSELNLRVIFIQYTRAKTNLVQVKHRS